MLLYTIAGLLTLFLDKWIAHYKLAIYVFFNCPYISDIKGCEVPAPAEVSASAKTACEAHLDSLYKHIVQEEGMVCVGVDRSVLSSSACQATVSAVVVVGSQVVSEP